MQQHDYAWEVGRVCSVPSRPAVEGEEPMGGEVNQRHLAQWFEVVVPQHLIADPGARLDGALLNPGPGVLGQGDVLGHQFGDPLFRRSPVAALDDPALIAQPPLGVHLGGEKFSGRSAGQGTANAFACIPRRGACGCAPIRVEFLMPWRRYLPCAVAMCWLCTCLLAIRIIEADQGTAGRKMQVNRGFAPSSAYRLGGSKSCQGPGY